MSQREPERGGSGSERDEGGCHGGRWGGVAKMASHAIFQYNVLAIDDIHNTWTNMIIKMTILRFLGSSDDKEKEKIGVARPKGPPLRGFRGRGSRGSRPSRVSGQRPESSSIQEHRKNRRQGIGASGGSRKNRRHDTLVQKGIEAKSAYRHRLNRRSKKGHRCNGRSLYQRRCQVPRRSFFSTG